MSPFDIIILGGGPVGWTAARALSQKGFKIALVEREPCQIAPDGRWFAFGPDLCGWFQELDMDVTPYGIASMVLSSHHGPRFVLEAQDLDIPSLAGVIGRHAFMDHVQTKNITLLRPDFPKIWRQNPTHWTLELSSGTTLQAPLLLSADGQHSQTRALFRPSVTCFTFPQVAKSFTFSPFFQEKAYEHFFPGGSLAILPLGQGKGSGIWVGRDAHTNVQQATETFLGHQVTMEGPVGQFPLLAQWSHGTVFDRCVILGDAAQVLHPIAGQSLNISLRIVRKLVDQLSAQRALGLDWATDLEPFETTRRRQAMPMALITSALVGVFSLSHHPRLWALMARTMRATPFLRRWVMGWAFEKNRFS